MACAISSAERVSVHPGDHRNVQGVPQAQRTEEIPFVVARIVLQDFTGVPLLVDLAVPVDQAAMLSMRGGLRILPSGRQLRPAA